MITVSFSNGKEEDDLTGTPGAQPGSIALAALPLIRYAAPGLLSVYSNSQGGGDQLPLLRTTTRAAGGSSPSYSLSAGTTFLRTVLAESKSLLGPNTLGL